MRPPTRITVTDWARLLWDMVQRGENLLCIERTTGIKESTLREYLKGSQPPHWRGERLIALWCRVCDKTRGDAPMTELVIAPRVVHPAPTVQADQAASLALSEVTYGWRITA